MSKKPSPEKIQPTKIMATIPPTPSIQEDPQPEPPGQTVFVCASKFSKAFSLQAAHDFKAGKVEKAGQILLPDGQIIAAGPTYETIMSSDLIQMVKSGVLQASTFGKTNRAKGI